MKKLAFLAGIVIGIQCAIIPFAAYAADNGTISNPVLPGDPAAPTINTGLTPVTSGKQGDYCDASTPCDTSSGYSCQSSSCTYTGTNSATSCNASTGVCSCSALNQTCPSGQSCNVSTGTCSGTSNANTLTSTTCTPACGTGQTCQSGICTATLTNASTVTGLGTNSNSPAISGNCASSDGFVSLSCIPGFASAEQSNSLASFFNVVYQLCIGIAAVIAVIQITRAGILYMGSDSVGNKTYAKELIQMSVIGLVLVLAPVLIFGIINKNILSLSLNGLSGLNIAPGPAAPATPATPNTTTVIDQSSASAPGNHIEVSGTTCTSNLASSCTVALTKCPVTPGTFFQGAQDYTCINKTTGVSDSGAMQGTGAAGVCPTTDYAQVLCAQQPAGAAVPF